MKWLIRLCLFLIIADVKAHNNNEEPCEHDGPVGSLAVVALASTKKMNEKCNVDTKKKLANICSVIADKKEDFDPESDYLFLYQRIIFEASCVNPSKDSKIEISSKVSEMWSKNENYLRCTGSDFDIKNGSLLKYAVAKRFRQVIYDAANVWKLDLNRIDQSDGRTVLDYVQSEINLNKGGPNEAILIQYFDTLRKAGAKLKKEL